MRETKIKVPLYEIDFNLKVYDSSKEVKKSSIEYPYKDRIGCVYTKKEQLNIVLNKYHKLTVGEIAHEVKHLVNEILIYINAQLDLNNDEFECYLLQWVMDEVYNFYEKN